MPQINLVTGWKQVEKRLRLGTTRLRAGASAGGTSPVPLLFSGGLFFSRIACVQAVQQAIRVPVLGCRECLE